MKKLNLFAYKAPPPIQYFPREICDTLEEFRNLAAEVISFVEASEEHPETLRVKAFAAQEHIPFVSLKDTVAYQLFEEAVANACSVATEPNERPFNRKWCSAHARVVDATTIVLGLLKDEQHSRPFHEAFHKIAETGEPYEGPRLTALVDLFAHYDKIGKMLRAMEHKLSRSSTPRRSALQQPGGMS